MEPLLLAMFGGEVLPLPDMRSSAAVVSVVVGIGEMGECASGDSGVLHRSFVSGDEGKEWHRIGFN